MRRAARTTPVLGALCLASAVVASNATAQPSSASASPRFEVAAGGLWIGGAGMGSASADLRANSVQPRPFPLFATDTRTASAGGLDLRVGYWLTPTLAIEGGFMRSRPELQTDISDDVEDAESLTVVERLDQYFVDASIVWQLERFRFGGTTPFVGAGAGYLRQLHEGRTLVETGQVYNVGGGIRHVLMSRPSGWIRRVGARVDGRVYFLVNGVQLEDRARTHGALSGAIFVGF